jgi:acyl carrier protein
MGNDSMNADELLGLFAEALEADVSTISMETAIAEVPEWSSLVWLSVMSLLDERYGIQLSAKEIRSFKTVREAVDCITAKIEAAR